ncbi:MAG: preprotein translocase subunit YajC [Betaproteobacteria bacterium RIFCSPLOWO2_02_FULL_67_26]|nr:MAG: preprotein translocase subunit YajC [Betaproteobacteria bacterium RIFCSPLOWO2_02_FULL_67_26]
MLINPAWAQTPGGGAAGGGIESLVLIVLMFAVLYFLMIRPQMKRAKEHKGMIDALQKGDEVVAAGGMLGRISRLNENYVTLEVSDKVEVQIQRPSVQLVLPKGTIKNIQ